MLSRSGEVCAFPSCYYKEMRDLSMFNIASKSVFVFRSRYCGCLSSRKHKVSQTSRPKAINGVHLST